MFLGLRNLGNICCGHKMSFEQNQKHFLCPGPKICVRDKCCARANGETFVSATMCPQQCVLVFQGIKSRGRHALSSMDHGLLKSFLGQSPEPSKLHTRSKHDPGTCLARSLGIFVSKRKQTSKTRTTPYFLVSSAAVIRVVTQRFSSTNGRACALVGRSLRDDPNNGCEGEYLFLGSRLIRPLGMLGACVT